MTADISPDGDFVVFSVCFEDVFPFCFAVPIEEMARLQNTVNSAAVAMTQRQRLKVDRGCDKLQQFFQAALRPAVTHVRIDPYTGDRLFTHQFRNHAPLAVRLSPAAIDENIEKLHAAARRARN